MRGCPAGACQPSCTNHGEMLPRFCLSPDRLALPVGCVYFRDCVPSPGGVPSAWPDLPRPWVAGDNIVKGRRMLLGNPSTPVVTVGELDVPGTALVLGRLGGRAGTTPRQPAPP